MNTNKNVVLLKIGNNITQLRKSKGWTQEELAFECQLHRTYIGSVERGERNIAILNLFKIANALGVEVKEIIKQDSN